MRHILKKIVVVVVALVAGWTCFAKGSEYATLLAKAKEYEAKKMYVHALGTYWDAMEAESLGNASEAYDAYINLARVIKKGNPGYGEFDEFELYDGWLELCSDYEQYWTECCPCVFSFQMRKGDVDVAARTASYYVDITVDENYKYKDISNFILTGLKAKRKKNWTSIPAEWPAGKSVYWKESSDMKKNGVALIKSMTGGKSTDAMSAALWSLLSKDKKSSMYDVKFNITDDAGKVLLSSGRKRMGSDGEYEFTDVSQKIMKVIDSGSIHIVPVGLWLEYGKLAANYYNDSREWINNLPEISLDVKKAKFNLPGQPEKNKYTRITVELFSESVNAGSFYIQKTEVTQEQYLAVMGKNPSHYKGDRKPVDELDWCAAVEYCNYLNIMLGLTPCYSVKGITDPAYWGHYKDDEVECDFTANGWRLPTEKEWEYAAREGKNKSEYKYSGSNNIDEVAWYEGNTTRGAHDVATKKPNALGLYDMSGNVWEWCWEKYSTTDRVYRGGSWFNRDGGCAIAYRYYNYPGNKYSGYMGARLVRTAN